MASKGLPDRTGVTMTTVNGLIWNYSKMWGPNLRMPLPNFSFQGWKAAEQMTTLWKNHPITGKDDNNISHTVYMGKRALRDSRRERIVDFLSFAALRCIKIVAAGWTGILLAFASHPHTYIGTIQKKSSCRLQVCMTRRHIRVSHKWKKICRSPIS